MNEQNNPQTTNLETTLYRIILILIISIGGGWAYGLKSFVDAIPQTVSDTQTVTDGIIVLTGGSDRVRTGLELLAEEKAKRMLISGVAEGSDLASIILAARATPANIADLSDRIDLGYAAKSTKGNAEEAVAWVKEHNFTTIRLVTANYHISRSMMEFTRLMPDVTIIPHPVAPYQFSLDHWWRYGATKRVLIKEYHKYLASKFHLL